MARPGELSYFMYTRCGPTDLTAPEKGSRSMCYATRPPDFSILILSSASSGLWSLLKGWAIHCSSSDVYGKGTTVSLAPSGTSSPLIEAKTALESPTFAQYMYLRLLENITMFTVVPEYCRFILWDAKGPHSSRSALLNASVSIAISSAASPVCLNSFHVS